MSRDTLKLRNGKEVSLSTIAEVLTEAVRRARAKRDERHTAFRRGEVPDDLLLSLSQARQLEEQGWVDIDDHCGLMVVEPDVDVEGEVARLSEVAKGLKPSDDEVARLAALGNELQKEESK